MADNLKRQPKKGILKNSSSFETEERQRELHKGTKWDEMNILATHHPKDKDYGHMKIEEPKTPFSYETNDSGDEIDGIDADLLAQKMELEGSERPKALTQSSEESSDEEEINDETPEEKAKRLAFEMKRKHHYNEFAAVKLARKLMEEDNEEEDVENKIVEEEELEEEDVTKDTSSGSKNVDQKNSG